MLRASLCWMTVLVFCVGVVAADDTAKEKDKTAKKGQGATITKVDAKKRTVTVKMKDKEGKEVQKTFNLTGEVQLFDDNGKTIRLADIDIFRSGDYVLYIERDGQLRELRKDPDAKKTDQKKSSNK